MKKSNIRKIVWLTYLLPFSLFANRMPTLEDIVNSFRCQRITKEIFFEKNGPVHVKCSFPVLSGKGILIEHVNTQLEKDAREKFEYLVRDEFSSEEVWDDGCTLDCELLPVYQTQNLISIYGCDFQGRGCHGCTYYEGKTFWRKGDSVVKLVLDDLFVKGSGYRQFLLQYCENLLKATGYGYYSSRIELPPELGPSDLDIFLPTDKGLMIVFRAYTVGGWADGPDTVLIPYTKLKKFIDPLGPLKEFSM